MPIHDQGYRRYLGTRMPRGRAWAVITTAGLRTFFGRRTFLGLLLMAWLPFVVFVTVYVGAGLIANDRRANALQIYLSKPLTRGEYVLGKMAILMTFLLMVTWLPAIVLLLVQVSFAGSFTFLKSNLYLFPAITLL